MQIGDRLGIGALGLGLLGFAILIYRYRESLHESWYASGIYPIPLGLHNVWITLCAFCLGVGGATLMAIAVFRCE